MSTPPVVPLLADLSRLRGVRAVLLTSMDDALTIESSAHVDVDLDALAAFATALCRRAHQTAAVGGMGDVRVVALEAAAGRLLAAFRGRLLLVVLAERETSPGMIRLLLSRALEGLV